MEAESQNIKKELLRRRKNEYSKIVSILPVAVYICDSNGYVEYYNEAAAELWGRRPKIGEERWCGAVKGYTPEGEPLTLENSPTPAALKGNKCQSMEIIIECPDGTKRSVLSYPKPIYDEDEKEIIGVVNALIDITNQVNSRKKVEESRKQVAFIADSIPQKVWTAGADGKISYFNEQWYSYTGNTKEQLEDLEHRRMLVHPDDRVNNLHNWEHSMASGENFESEIRFLNKDGEYKWHIARGLPCRDGNGNITMWVGSMTEIEEQKKQKEDLEKTIADRTRDLKKANVKLTRIINTHEYAEEISNLGSYRYNFVTQEIKFSDNLYRLLGCEPGEFEAGWDNLLKFVHPDDVEYLKKSTNVVFTEKKVSNWTYRIIRKNKEVIYVRGTGRFITNKNNLPIMIGTIQDITLQKIQEEKIIDANFILEKQNETLLESEERFLKVFDNNPVAMTLAELKSKKIIYANNMFNKTFGYNKEELIGKTSDEMGFISAEEATRLTNLLLAHMQETRSLEELKNLTVEEAEEFLVNVRQSDFMNSIEIEYIRKNGEKFYGLASYELIRIGNERYTVTSVQDITKRKLAEDKLKKSEEQYHRIVNEVEDYAIISLTKEGIIENWNEGAQKIKGYTAEEIIGKNFSIFYTIQDRKEGLPESLLQKAIKYDKANHEGWRIRKDGSIFWGNVVITALHDRDNNVIGFSKITRDLTAQKQADDEIKQANEQLRKQNEQLKKINQDLQRQKEEKDNAELKKQIAEKAVKSKQQFLANMSHEIRTPMNSIIGFTNVMMNTELSKEQKEHLNAIKVSGDALLVIINDILDLAKVDSGKMAFEKTPFNLLDSIWGTLHLMEGKIKEKNLELIRQYDKSLPQMVVGDPVRLRQVILNLLSNAVKFTDEGSVSLQLNILMETPTEINIAICVNDTGIGIPKDRLDTIFDSFEQVSVETSRLYGGTGLGLAIVKKLVELQGGKLEVESELGKGSSFCFSMSFGKTNLQVDTETHHYEKLVKKDPNQKQLKNVKILVAEDVLLNQMLMKIMLTEFRFEFDIAENGKIALEKLKENDYDIILMDLQMPEMNGFETTAYIREELKSNIPIIALTADVTSMDIEKSKVAGMNDYVPKPIDDKLLYKKLLGYLKNKKVS